MLNANNILETRRTAYWSLLIFFFLLILLSDVTCPFLNCIPLWLWNSFTWIGVWFIWWSRGFWWQHVFSRFLQEVINIRQWSDYWICMLNLPADILKTTSATGNFNQVGQVLKSMSDKLKHLRSDFNQL